MKELDVALKAVVEGLRVLAQGVEKIAEKLEGSVPKRKLRLNLYVRLLQNLRRRHLKR